MEAIQKLSYDDALLIECLDREPVTVALAVQARRENNYDTAYDHFLYDYIGDTRRIDQPDLRRNFPLQGERVYDQRLLASYSQEGRLVCVRSTSIINPENRPLDFFVATADLINGAITEWGVTEVVFKGQGSSLRTEIILHEGPYIEPQAPAGYTESNDSIESVIESKLQQAAKRSAALLLPRVVLTGQGCFFSNYGQMPEPLAPIYELTEKVDSIFHKFGRTVLLRESPQIAADTMAA